MGVGSGIIIGAVIGTLLFAISGQASLIGIGAALGVVLGAILESISGREDIG